LPRVTDLGLRDLPVLALDGQASGATPAHGDLLELGWAVCSSHGLAEPVASCWITPRSSRPISRAVRTLTGWSEQCVPLSVDERTAWHSLREASERATVAGGSVPTIIHFARFEVAFLRDLHERLEGTGELPFDAVCLHAVAERLFPDLPRRNLRALSGYLGHSPELVRRASGHVAATAVIWRGVVPMLEERGVGTWSELKAWLGATSRAPRSRKRSFPLAEERRRALPKKPGVYRFLRRSGDVLYVGKATSLRSRVAGHFKRSGPTTERSLELLTQVHDIDYVETESLLEAALLETDEIKRLDPPYNVQLKLEERRAWFATRDWREAAPAPDEVHSVGPLSSERALAPLFAITALASGCEASPRLRATALAVPPAIVPDAELFEQGFRVFCAERLDVPGSSPQQRVALASRRLWRERGRAEVEPEEGERDSDEWDLARVQRRLERSLVQGGLLVRRAVALGLLVDAEVAFREPGSERVRFLTFAGGRVTDRGDLGSLAELRDRSPRRGASLWERKRAFDAATYDRLRVLLTELQRVIAEGGEVAIRLGRRYLADRALARWFLVL
jgi:DNA polymerase-3 subunit epsilon